jgi:hypothetical protein
MAVESAFPCAFLWANLRQTEHKDAYLDGTKNSFLFNESPCSFATNTIGFTKLTSPIVMLAVEWIKTAETNTHSFCFKAASQPSLLAFDSPTVSLSW